jgi:hypothetical protein
LLLSARAAERIGETAKAIDYYKDAVRLAPDEASRKTAAEELRLLHASWYHGRWFASLWSAVEPWAFPLALVLLVVVLRILMTRFIRWYSSARDEGPREIRVRITSPRKMEETAFFRSLLEHMQCALSRQQALEQRIGEALKRTVTPTAVVRFETLLPLPSMSAKLDAGLLWSLARHLTGWLDPPQYTVHVDLFRADKTGGATVRLSDRRAPIAAWYSATAEQGLPNLLAELAFKTAASIRQHETLAQDG